MKSENLDRLKVALDRIKEARESLNKNFLVKTVLDCLSDLEQIIGEVYASELELEEYEDLEPHNNGDDNYREEGEAFT